MVQAEDMATSSLISKSRLVRRIDARFVSKLTKIRPSSLFERTALDSHADTSCAGSNAVALELTGEKVNVYPFTDDLPAVKEVPIATALSHDMGKPIDRRSLGTHSS